MRGVSGASSICSAARKIRQRSSAASRFSSAPHAPVYGFCNRLRRLEQVHIHTRLGNRAGNRVKRLREEIGAVYDGRQTGMGGYPGG